jgi:uncharacterized protein YdaU (DUF1376 family)
MAKDPAILFYTSDFLTGTLLMSFEEKGIYIHLLCIQHQLGGIPEKDMSIICKGYDSVFRKFEKGVDGIFRNKRMQEEIEKRVSYSESRKKNRLSKKDTPIISPTHDEHMSKHMENENENENENIIIDVNKDVVEKIHTAEIYPTFDDFWNLYDLKEDKKDCVKKWGKLTQSEKELIMLYIEPYKSSLSDLKYQRNPVTFINKRTWENELKKSTQHGKQQSGSATVEQITNKLGDAFKYVKTQ